MASPVTSTTICDLRPSSTSTVCQRVKSALIEIPARLCDFFSWMFDASGNFTDAFKFMVASIIYTPGDFKHSGTSNQPAGWSLCDGSELSRTTDSRLFANVGTTWGIGDGLTTFNKPDFRGRALIGAGAGAGLTSRTIGEQTIGEEGHVQTVAELALHHHPITAETPVDINAGSIRTLAGESTNPAEFDESMDTGDAGSSSPMNVMQPSGVAYIYIFTGRFS